MEVCIHNIKQAVINESNRNYVFCYGQEVCPCRRGKKTKLMKCSLWLWWCVTQIMWQWILTGGRQIYRFGWPINHFLTTFTLLPHTGISVPNISFIQYGLNGLHGSLISLKWTHTIIELPPSESLRYLITLIWRLPEQSKPKKCSSSSRGYTTDYIR